MSYTIMRSFVEIQIQHTLSGKSGTSKKKGRLEKHKFLNFSFCDFFK